MADPVAVIVPHETVNDESVKLLRLLVNDGDVVTKHQIIAEIETSKAVLELDAPVAGVVRLVTTVGQEVPIGSPLCFIAESADAPLPVGATLLAEAVPEPFRASQLAPSGPNHNAHRPTPHRIENAERDHQPAVRFTPLARKMAEEAGLALTDFIGIRIVRSADVKARAAGLALPSRGAGPATKPSPTPARDSRGEAPLLAAGVDVTWEELPRRKQVEIRQIAAGMARVLPSSVVVAARTSGLRAAVASFPVPGLTSSSVVIFETARLLRKYPYLNAIYSDGKVGYYGAVNIGIAIDDGSGLMVPVIRDADRKTLPEIAAESRSLLDF